jgi:hypothetical protein
LFLVHEYFAVIRDFIGQKLSGVNLLLQDLKFKLSDGHLYHALQSAVFPPIASTLMPLVYKQNAASDDLILKTAAVVKEAQLPALDYLKLGPKLLGVLMQGVSNAGIVPSSQYSEEKHAESASCIPAESALCIPAECMNLPFWPVYSLLRSLSETATPMKKLVVLNSSMTLISSCVSHYSANTITLSGDDLLPLLVFCISMSELKHPLSEMNFIAEFVQMGDPSSEQLYCLNLFEIALALMQQLHRDLGDISKHTISATGFAAAVDDDDTEEEVSSSWA